MTAPVDLRFFEALGKACSRSEDVDDHLCNAIQKALESGDPRDFETARKALDKMDNSLKDTLLRQVHHHMARDLSAIWDARPGAPSGRRPN